MGIYHYRGVLLAVILLVVPLLACYPEALLPDVTATPVPTSAAVSTHSPILPTLEATTAPVRTPETVQLATQAMTRALQRKDASELSALLIDGVFLAKGPNGEVGDTISRDDAVKWLDARWGASRQVISSDYVEHTVMLEIDTSGWARVAPMQNGRISFRLHRYNAQGQEDGLAGDWRIDTIIYE